VRTLPLLTACLSNFNPSLLRRVAGLNWLYLLHSQKLNGILADESIRQPPLSTTASKSTSTLTCSPFFLFVLQWALVKPYKRFPCWPSSSSTAISDRTSSSCQRRVRSLLALRAPLLTGGQTALHNWKNELASWCPDLKVFIYYGNMVERSKLRVEGTRTHSTCILLRRAWMWRSGFDFLIRARYEFQPNQFRTTTTTCG
jgi:hypothetical protein